MAGRFKLLVQTGELQRKQTGDHQYRVGHQGEADVQQQLGMGLQMGYVATRDQGAGSQQQGREAVDHRQQDPAVEAAGYAGHEATDDEADQRGNVEHAQVLAVTLQYL